TPMIDQRVGWYLRKGDLFATVEQADAVQVEIQVPEADAPQVEIGARVKVVAWAFPDETFYGTVKEIAPIAATPAYAPALPKFNAVRVVAELPNADFRFKSQITGFAKIKTEMIPVWRVFSRLVLRWLKVQLWYWIP
ncbi:MAG TPA: efflux RND transporter periplasmic adaptor subunit, partial [Candidatus Polarisedimenticolia bacterium]|nr:efflux RND transporter periplasmic adaptor subunit [Candidatus Polarisedimenticolia bacterium]